MTFDRCGAGSVRDCVWTRNGVTIGWAHAVLPCATRICLHVICNILRENVIIIISTCARDEKFRRCQQRTSASRARACACASCRQQNTNAVAVALLPTSERTHEETVGLGRLMEEEEDTRCRAANAENNVTIMNTGILSVAFSINPVLPFGRAGVPVNKFRCAPDRAPHRGVLSQRVSV